MTEGQFYRTRSVAGLSGYILQAVHLHELLTKRLHHALIHFTGRHL